MGKSTTHSTGMEHTLCFVDFLHLTPSCCLQTMADFRLFFGKSCPVFDTCKECIWPYRAWCLVHRLTFWLSIFTDQLNGLVAFFSEYKNILPQMRYHRMFFYGHAPKCSLFLFKTFINSINHIHIILKFNDSPCQQSLTAVLCIFLQIQGFRIGYSARKTIILSILYQIILEIGATWIQLVSYRLRGLLLIWILRA